MNVGDTVTWVNQTDRHFGLASGTGAWSTVRVEDKGGTWSFRFSLVGSYPYTAETSSGSGQRNFSGVVTVDTGLPPTASPTPSSGGTAQPTPTSSVPSSGNVSIINRSFQPATLFVAAGGTVTWTNNDGAAHTVTSDAGVWESGRVDNGVSYSRAFNEGGTYNYLCAFHPEMRGSVVVGPGTANPQPTPAAMATPVPAPTPVPATSTPAGVGPTPTPTATPIPMSLDSGTVSMVDFSFQPATMTVAVGATVRWTNNDAALHTVSGETGPWDSGIIARGRSYGRVFNESGTYKYFCAVHPQMRGAVVVGSEASASLPLPTLTPTPSPSAPTPTPAVPTPMPTAAVPTPAPTAVPAATPAAPDGSSAAGGASSGNADVRIASLSFQPGSLVVVPGATVTWVNDDIALHTVASGSPWDSGVLARGERFSRKFDETGAFAYFCAIHPNMKGVVIVAASAAQTSNSSSAANPPGSPGAILRPTHPPTDTASGPPSTAGDRISMDADSQTGRSPDVRGAVETPVASVGPANPHGRAPISLPSALGGLGAGLLAGVVLMYLAGRLFRR